MAIGIYKCLYDFAAQLENDLTIYSGDIIKVTKQINSDWLAGIANNKEGQFPCSYAERLLHSLPDKVGVVLNSFSGEQEGDLTIRKGDVVGIVENVDANWMSGFTNTGKGIFPAKFIKVIDFSRFPSTNSNSNAKNGDNLKISSSNTNLTNVNLMKNGNVIENKKSNSIPWGKAVDNFHAQQVDELTINKGDDIELIKEIDNFWMEGKIKGKHGKFPKEFVKVIHDLPLSLKYSEFPEKEEDEPVPHAKAMHMFVGENSNEISFDKGDVIVLVEHFNKDWMKGRIGKSVGLFPINHVKILVDLPYTSKGPKPKSRPSLSVQLNARTSSSCNHSVPVSSNGQHTEKKNLFPDSPLPQVKNSPSLNEQQNYFPIPPTIYPKPNANEPISNQLKPPEVKRRSFKKKNMVKNPTVETQELASSPAVTKKNTKSPVVKPALPLSKKIDGKLVKNAPKSPNEMMPEFELTQERVSLNDGIDNKPPLLPRCPTDGKPPILPRCPTNSSTKAKAPPRPDTQHAAKLPKPLVPVPVTPPEKERPNSLDVKTKPGKNDALLSPVAMVNPKSLTVSYRKEEFDFNANLGSMSFKKDSTDSIDSRSSHFKTRTSNAKISVDERDIRKISEQRKLTNELINLDSPAKSLPYSLPMSPARRQTIESNKSPMFVRPVKINLPSPQDDTDSIDSFNSIELKRIETRIVELKGKIEAEAYQLSGVETLLDFVSEDKIGDLVMKREKHNENITELNEELNALEDEKSSLLASFGKLDDVKNRVQELEKQIEMYLDNCEQLRRMQDVSVVEELPEIRDNIEFCENMVDTLLDELNGLREKLGEFDQPDAVPDPEMQLAKRKRNQKKVVEELIQTEEKYINDLTFVLDIMKHLEEQMNNVVNIKVLFGNLPCIVELAKRLLCELKESNSERIALDEIPSRIATCFLDLATQMKECYADYCRNYDDAQNLLERYEEDPELWFGISQIVEVVSPANAIANLQAYLIKPVQRVLKYPLLLAELLKNHVTEGLSRDVLKLALEQMTDVATAINEFKRRKDLVQKYREIEDGIGKKVQKLNWHSVAKKSSRINQRITQFTGLNSQTVDQDFGDSEKRFRGLEKLIKSFLKNVVQFVEDFQKNTAYIKQCSESIRQFHDDTEVREEVIKYYSRVYVITEQYASNMVIFINRHVTDPLNQMLLLFQGPFRLIQKRNDKCLDYDRARNKAMRAKDSKDEDKIKQTKEELQISENIYTALNAQLLEELPELCNKSSSFLKYCMSNFVETYKRYLSSSYHQIYELWQLPFVSKEGDMFEIHQELINQASDRLSLLSFVPFQSSKDANKSSSSQTLPNLNRTSFFVDLDEPGSDPTSPIKPLIDFNANDFDEVDKASVKAKVFGTNDWTHQDETNNYIVKYNFVAEDEVELSATEGTKVTVLRKSDKNGNNEWWYVELDGKKGYIPQSYLVADKDDVDANRINTSNSKVLTPRKIKTTKQIEDNLVSCSDLPDPPLEFIQDLTDEHMQTNNRSNRFNNFSRNCEKDLSNNSLSSEIKEDHTLTSQTSMNSNDTKQPQSYGNVQYYFMEYSFEGINPGELTVREGELVKVISKYDQKGNTEWWLVDYNGMKGYVPGGFLVFVDEAPMC